MNFIAGINDPRGRLGEFMEAVRTIGKSSRRVRFVLALAGTATSDKPGVSAAGATPELCRLTPSADAEVLVLGQTSSGQRLPTSPRGIVSPVVLTCAALSYLEPTITLVDCGAFQAPGVDHLSLGGQPANCVSTGQAMEHALVERLFLAGMEFGRDVASADGCWLLAECVPGGTTTASALLKLLGYDPEGLISSSLPGGSPSIRNLLLDQGLRKAALLPEQVTREPLKAVAAMGDPMQPFVAGAAIAASRRVPVMLCGGSQMLAVWALIVKLAAARGYQLDQHRLAVMTTKWVAYDPAANSSRLSMLVGAPFAASCLDLSLSCHEGLRAYEQGHVKEGAGAGGALAAAHLLASVTGGELLATTDSTYNDLVLGKQLASRQ